MNPCVPKRFAVTHSRCEDIYIYIYIKIEGNDDKNDRSVSEELQSVLLDSVRACLWPLGR